MEEKYRVFRSDFGETALVQKEKNTFLGLLRSRNIICDDPDGSFFTRIEANGDRMLQCTTCNFRKSISQLLCQEFDSTLSVYSAEVYARWTGDADVPCLFHPLLRCRILPVEIVTRVSTLAEGCQLLRALHTPFAADRYREGGVVVGSARPFPKNEPFVRRLFGTLASHHRSLVQKVSEAKYDLAGRSSVGEIAAAILAYVGKCAFPDDADPFDRYFRILAPRAMQAAAAVAGSNLAKDGSGLFSRRIFDSHEGLPLDELLTNEFGNCAVVYRTYSRHCASFDAVHVAVLCFLFQDRLSTVCNLVLDFGANFLCGYYEGSFRGVPVSDLELHVWNFLDRFVSPSKNPRFYYHLLKYRKGGDELADWFSEDFFETFLKLKRVAKENASRLSKDDLFERTFPRMLFVGKDFSDFHAFETCVTLYASEKKDRERGVVSRCKSLYSFLRKCFSKMNAFRESFATAVFQKDPSSKVLHHYMAPSPKYDIYWTVELLERFMELDLDFEKELMEVLLEYSPLSRFKVELSIKNNDQVATTSETRQNESLVATIDLHRAHEDSNKPSEGKRNDLADVNLPDSADDETQSNLDFSVFSPAEKTEKSPKQDPPSVINDESEFSEFLSRVDEVE